MKHSVLFMEKVDETLKQANMTLAECDFFAAVVGAGSFTGIRIGISAVKGFALAYNKPTLPVTSFDLAAYNAVEKDEKILCLIDAMHGAYYACGYEQGKVILPPAYLTQDEVLALCAQGYALRALAPIPLQERAAVELVDPVQGFARAVEVLEKRGAFAPLTAVYVRKSSAELNVCK